MQEDGFFLTEAPIGQDQNAIQEENESDNQEHQENQEQTNDQDHDEDEDDDEFDFGRAKMDFFKKRAREILTADAELEYEGNPMPLNGAYKNLKLSIKNPAIVYTKLENKPNYMKMTFSMGRQAPVGGKFMELTKANAISKSVAKLSGDVSNS